MRLAASSDFCAAAWTERSERLFRWQRAAGNLNERYRSITFRSGQDISGLAWKIGRPVIIDAGTAEYERRRKESPIMIAEQLAAALAIPVTKHADVQAVLLFGSRAPRTYTPADIASLSGLIDRFLADRSFFAERNLD
jgi:nitrogen regulatory protein A